MVGNRPCPRVPWDRPHSLVDPSLKRKPFCIPWDNSPLTWTCSTGIAGGRPRRAPTGSPPAARYPREPQEAQNLRTPPLRAQAGPISSVVTHDGTDSSRHRRARRASAARPGVDTACGALHRRRRSPGARHPSHPEHGRPMGHARDRHRRLGVEPPHRSHTRRSIPRRGRGAAPGRPIHPFAHHRVRSTCEPFPLLRRRARRSFGKFERLVCCTEDSQAAGDRSVVDVGRRLVLAHRADDERHLGQRFGLDLRHGGQLGIGLRHIGRIGIERQRVRLGVQRWIRWVAQPDSSAAYPDTPASYTDTSALESQPVGRARRRPPLLTHRRRSTGRMRGR